jgi:hypothetical protein
MHRAAGWQWAVCMQLLRPAPRVTVALCAHTRHRLQVQVFEKATGRSACCKSDGMRFAGADTTVKLRQDAPYLISITTLPAVALR